MTTNALIDKFETATGLVVEEEIPLKRANWCPGHERKLVKADGVTYGYFTKKSNGLNRYSIGVVELFEDGTKRRAALYHVGGAISLFLLAGVV